MTPKEMRLAAYFLDWFGAERSTATKNDGGSWFKPDGTSGSVKRKAASAEIARIPLTLARHVTQVAKRFAEA